MFAFHRQLMSFAIESVHDWLEGYRVSFWRRIVGALIAFPLLVILTGLGVTAVDSQHSAAGTFQDSAPSSMNIEARFGSPVGQRMAARRKRSSRRSSRRRRGRRKKSKTISVDAGKILWQVKVDGRIYSTPSIDSELVYVATTKGVLYAFEREGGVLRWQKTMEDQLAKSAPIPGKSRLFIGTQAGDLVAMDKTTGHEAWRFKTEATIVSSPVVDMANGVLYFTSRNGTVYALNTEDGSLQWQFNTGNLLDASPLLEEGVLYFGDYEGTAYALDTEDGSLNWRYSIEGPLLATPVLAGDSIYFSSAVGAMFALTKKDGFKRWSYTSPGGNAMVSTPTIMNDQVFIGDVDGTIGCVNNEFGIRVWQRSLKGAIMSSIKPFKQSLLVGTGNGKLVAIHPDSGKLLWKLELDSVLEADMAMSGSQVFLGSHNGNVYAVELSP